MEQNVNQTELEPINEDVALKEEPKKKEKMPKTNKFFSAPLFMQSLKSNWVLWLVLTLGSAFIFIIVNLVIGSRKIFTNIDMNTVTTYVTDEQLSWLKILGLLETMGFSLSRIQTMSQIDLNSIMNDLIYKIAGVLLPMVYVMITANKLVSAQVSDGSMAYILSTPTNRGKVLRTQLLFFLSSVFAMYIVITAFALSSEALAAAIMKINTGVEAQKFYLRSFLYCVGSFCAMFSLSGICFGASCFFNKSTRSLALGGGACILSFICCILGLFGSDVFVSVGVGVKAMSIFDYGSVYSLIDTSSMSLFAKSLAGTGDVISYTWIWKLAILIIIGVLGIVIGSTRFKRKDLPL